ncbi:hypothetical protein PHLGIDRAFT_131086 [Phlebiopsis gigantea 11061_1 CR5-6]|uniref:Myosin-binding domain-containing protein n=1 Tax=Phlebiopsis gigantea (strain 11061_1 CR5-6) TaxID=745531 RepID=A0A0C3NBJ7_PHLG1|nr:hypothetical protein PHLGIDRAFT_131086 [Phlebiopsis gigantea 11061_1 CR5-6]
MAQPVFDEHPLQEYFRESGEDSEPMPGSDTQFHAEAGPSGSQPQQTATARLVMQVLTRVMDTYQSLSTPKLASSSNSFPERFKYDVISSSLLSTSLAATPLPGRRSFAPEIPGRLASSRDHSRASSTSDDYGENQQLNPSELGLTRETIAIISVAVVVLAAGFEFLGLLLLAGALYYARANRPAQSVPDAEVLTLDAVNELISAGNVWDSAVNEAMSIIEKEERSQSSYYSPTSMQAPSAGLRVALQSSLHTTQSQCDHVRQLLSALTSPPQLAQLSEMYAPASPVKPSFISFDQPRPLSDPLAAWRRRTTSMPSAISTANKRATWSPSRGSLAAVAGMNAMRRNEKRRSAVNPAFLSPTVPSSTMSAPPSPLAQKVLTDVDEDQEESDSELAYTKEEDVFGVAALDLRRQQRRSGMWVFGVPPPSYTIQPPQSGHTRGHSSHSSISSISSPSKFTLLQTNRHPLSLSSLHMALHGALAAKRYACAHLLALRFEEDADDETYWEDVRSIMSLFTSTFADASSMLLSALDEAEKQRMKDERPSTESLAGSSREGSVSPTADCKNPSARSGKTMAEMISFAPMPSHLVRFATHVDAITSALDDARDHIEQCVASIREDKDPHTCTMPGVDGSASDPFGVEGASESPALQAYDRLRKELGFALRECERGRERLLDILAASKPAPESDDEDEDGFADAPPSLAQDLSSEESNGPDSAFSERNSTFEIAVPDLPQVADDATEHLLLATSSQHLPPPGIEQVFEAESGPTAEFTRERPKLSREERIKLAKARRESKQASIDEKPEKEQWGPGGEVVQELKDVIWKVGERRRKMTERAASVGSVAEVRMEGDS